MSKAQIIGCTLSTVLYTICFLVEVLSIVNAEEPVFWFPYIAGFASACFVYGLVNNIKKLCEKEEILWLEKKKDSSIENHM